MDSLYLFVFTIVASTLGFLVATACIVGYLLFKRRFLSAVVFALSAAGLMVTVQVFKETFKVVRPANGFIEAAGYAFPSGHSAGIAFLGIMLAYFVSALPDYSRVLLYVVCGVAVLAVGYSRLQLGVHTPFQVAVGFLVGGLWAFVCICAIHQFKKSSASL